MKKENNRWVATDKPEPVIAIMFSHGGIFGNDNNPKKIIWKGKIRFDTPGTYNVLPLRFVRSKWNIKIDGKKLLLNKINISPDATGWHTFEVTYEPQKGAEAFWLGWITPGGEPHMIPPTHLMRISNNEAPTTAH
jgi:hypothetical protein